MHEGSHERQGMALGLAGSWLQQMSNQTRRLLEFEKKACLELLVPSTRGSFKNSTWFARWRWFRINVKPWSLVHAVPEWLRCQEYERLVLMVVFDAIQQPRARAECR